MMRNEVLSMYRAILRMGKQKLKLTDQDFFKRIVRLEFKKYMRVYSPEEIAFQKKVN